TISSEILPISTILPENSNQIKSEVFHLESTTLLNIPIKKRSSKSQSKSVRISDPISTNNSNIVASTLNETEKINSDDLDVLYEKEARRDEKNKANMTRLLTTT
ncbi:8456_t:CDS:1, partial [Ambispora gerdemannii]